MVMVMELMVGGDEGGEGGGEDGLRIPPPGGEILDQYDSEIEDRGCGGALFRE